MEKRDVFKCIILLLVLVLTLTGCDEKERIPVENPVLSAVIGEAGGVVEGLNGAVVLTVPPGALNEVVQFTMRELDLASETEEYELLRTFVIEPQVTFIVPAKLTVYTEGSLFNGKTITDEMDVVFYIYDDVQDYCSKCGQCCMTCCDEVTPNSVSSFLGKTGVIATYARMETTPNSNTIIAPRGGGSKDSN